VGGINVETDAVFVQYSEMASKQRQAHSKSQPPKEIKLLEGNDCRYCTEFNGPRDAFRSQLFTERMGSQPFKVDVDLRLLQ
jgi:hypothetical protein